MTMTYESIMEYLATWGLLFVFIVTFLEYCNLPGFPAALVYPVVGVYAHVVGQPVLLYILVSVVAACLGSIVLYCIGYLGGDKLMAWISRKFPKTYDKILIYQQKMIKKEKQILFITKLIPGIRTIISIPCGVNKMDFFSHLYVTAASVTIFNSLFILAGFLFGNALGFVVE